MRSGFALVVLALLLVLCGVVLLCGRCDAQQLEFRRGRTRVAFNGNGGPGFLPAFPPPQVYGATILPSYTVQFQPVQFGGGCLGGFQYAGGLQFQQPQLFNVPYSVPNGCPGGFCPPGWGNGGPGVFSNGNGGVRAFGGLSVGNGR